MFERLRPRIDDGPERPGKQVIFCSIYSRVQSSSQRLRVFNDNVILERIFPGIFYRIELSTNFLSGFFSKLLFFCRLFSTLESELCLSYLSQCAGSVSFSSFLRDNNVSSACLPRVIYLFVI